MRGGAEHDRLAERARGLLVGEHERGGAVGDERAVGALERAGDERVLLALAAAEIEAEVLAHLRIGIGDAVLVVLGGDARERVRLVAPALEIERRDAPENAREAALDVGLLAHVGGLEQILADLGAGRGRHLLDADHEHDARALGRDRLEALVHGRRAGRAGVLDAGGALEAQVGRGLQHQRRGEVLRREAGVEMAEHDLIDIARPRRRHRRAPRSRPARSGSRPSRLRAFRRLYGPIRRCKPSWWSPCARARLDPAQQPPRKLVCAGHPYKCSLHAGIMTRFSMHCTAQITPVASPANSGIDCPYGSPDLPLRAEPERLSASRPRALGAHQFRHGARGRRALPAAHRGHRRDALPARIRAGDLRGSRLARHRLGGAGAAPERAFRGLSRGARRSSMRRGSSIRASKAAPRSPRWSPSASAHGAWPRDPDGAPLYPGSAQGACRRPSARGASQAGEPYALRLDMAAALARAGALDWTETGAGPPARPGSWRPLRGLGRRRARAQGDADELSPRGRGRRCAAGRDPRGARAGPVLVDQRPPRCCRRCSACRRRAIITTAWSSTPTAGSCRNRPRATALRELAGSRAQRRPTSGGWSVSVNGCSLAEPRLMALRARPWQSASGGGADAEDASEESAAKRRATASARRRAARRAAARDRGDAGGARPRHPHAADRHPGAGRAAGDLRARRARARLGGGDQEHGRASRHARRR